MTFGISKEGIRRRKLKGCMDSTCNTKLIKKRLPILRWLPRYKAQFLVQDIIAGITVGLTAIPQGIAYAIVAGLPPEQGLYASLTAGIVYAIFGSCSYVTVGPTAIMAALTARYVSNYSAEFAVLATFLSGLVIFALGVLNMGFLVEFISMPVISGFTTAAALQITTSQLKGLFGLSGSSGSFFAESVHNFIEDIRTMRSIWEPILGFSTIVILLLLKKMSDGCKDGKGLLSQMCWYISLSRNAVAIIAGMILTYILKVTLHTDPLNVIGEINNGLPKFGLPPFSTVVGNETYSFTDMLEILGPRSIALPLISLLEVVAISKAFANGVAVDATQEMIALGLCNIVGSFGQSMPITGSFSRTALNHFSGVKTPAGGIANVALIIIALTCMTSTFYYIPKSSLCGLIIVAMIGMFDFSIMKRLWKSSKRELFVLLTTMIVCLLMGLEYGIVVGIAMEAGMLLYRNARPAVVVNITKCEKTDLMVVPLAETLSYCAAEHIRRTVLKASANTVATETLIVIDGSCLRSMDCTVASNLMSVVHDLQKNSRQIVFMNFSPELKSICLDIDPSCESKFVSAMSPIDLSHNLTCDIVSVIS